MKKEHEKIRTDQKLWTQGYYQYRDFLSCAHYRDPYFDFMYFADQLFVSVYVANCYVRCLPIVCNHIANCYAQAYIAP